MNYFPSRLKLLREEHQYTQKQIADELGISQSYYAKFEYGNREPGLEMLVRICKHFNVSADYLLGLIDGDTNDSHLEYLRAALSYAVDWKQCYDRGKLPPLKLKNAFYDNYKMAGLFFDAKKFLKNVTLYIESVIIELQDEIERIEDKRRTPS